MTPIARLGLFLFPLALTAGSPRDAASTASTAGTYRMELTAKVSSPPLLEREAPVRADAVLEAGDARGSLRIRLLSQGYTCDLSARLDAGGTVSLAPEQHCTLDLNEPGASGRVEARLLSGKGQVGAGRLALDLRFGLSGAVKLGRLPGLDLPLPGQLATEVPVSGEAHASGEGKRDESRAGGG